MSFVRAPRGFKETLGELPEGAAVGHYLREPRDVIVLFTRMIPDLGRILELKWSLAQTGGLWVAYPKKASGVATNLSFESVQEAGLAAGLVDNKSCSIDDVWTAVRFVIRKEDRRELR